MNKKERVLAALRRQPVDRIPRGELAIEPGFTENYLADVKKPMSALEKEVYIRNELGNSDGYLHDVLQDIVDCGFDAIQSLQPSAGLDIGRVKKEFGDKLCLIGNVDLNYLLPFGTPDEVTAEVKKLAETAGPEGFILSTCNILTDAVKVENAKAMYFFDKE